MEKLRKINLFCTETGALVHVVQDPVPLKEVNIKTYEKFYSRYYNKFLFAEIAE